MKRILLTILLSWSTFACAETWEEIVALPELKISIDRDSVRKVDSVIYGWQRWTYAKDQVFQGMTYRTSKSLIYSDCGRRTRANAHVLLLNEAGAKLYDRPAPTLAFAPLIPDTYPDMVHALI